MILIEKYPIDALVSKFVDRYQLYHFKEKGFFKSVPNGKIEFYIVSEGGFEQWTEKAFETCNDYGLMPATNQLGFYQIKDHLRCLNIKLNLSILSLPAFEDYLTKWNVKTALDFVSVGIVESLKDCISKDSYEIPVEKIDTILHDLVSHKANEEILRLIETMESSSYEDFKVTTLADQLNMSSKTLERLVKKYFNLTPKELWKVIRFENATSHLKKSENQKLIEALSFGYYDQSHFIKECKKITGYSPKEFFSKLKLPTNDLIFENIQSK